ncbi:MAG TPA: hypothetical protein VMT52_17095, partial [Planctomycetota bacterium]|nr:hypothetical protein [Planctomycetota bacterium]
MDRPFRRFHLVDTRNEIARPVLVYSVHLTMNAMFALRAAAAIAALSSAGCGLFYRNSFPGPAFTIYSDRDPAFLAEIGEKVTRIYAGYQRLFEPAPGSLGSTTIVLEGTESGIVDHGYSPSLLGYYVPLFNYIHIDTVPAWTRNEEFLEQVILHEVAHHFIVSEWPAASSECWLNEGLAGALEVSVFRGHRFESPLLNPVLYQIAHRAAHDQGRKLDLKRFLAMTWNEFHDRESKERNYALAWSIVYFALERVLPREVAVGERIEMLYRMDRSAIARL